MRAGAASAALAALLIVPLLAGCSGGPDPPAPAVDGVPAADLADGAFYAFAHPGGSLVFTLAEEGAADLELYDGGDRRLGGFGFTSQPPQAGRYQLDGVAAGELVLRVLSLNGTLRVRSGGQEVAHFRPLDVVVERHVLVNRPPSEAPSDPLGLPGFPVLGAAQPADVDVPLSIGRAPSSLRLLASDVLQELTVEARSARGVVLTAHVPSSSPAPLGGGRALALLPSELRPQNLRDGELEVSVRADDLHGALLIEAVLFSRHAAPSAGEPHAGTVRFTYGELRAGATQAAVHPDARMLYLRSEGGAPARAVVFGPDDRRLAAVEVPAGRAVRVPVAGGGEHVVALLAGRATLGADAVPADFELHPLGNASTVAPAEAAGQDGTYGQGEAALEGARVWRLRPASVAAPTGEIVSPSLTPCDTDRQVRLAQAGEGIVSIAEASGPPEPEAARWTAALLNASLRLGDGPVAVHHDGFGEDGCPRPAVEALAYVRRELA